MDSSLLRIENQYPNTVFNTEHTVQLGRSGITAKVSSFLSHCSALVYREEKILVDV